MNIAALLSSKYDQISYTVMRPLFKNCLVEDFNKEIIDYKATIEKIQKALSGKLIKEEIDKVRPLARAFLNEVHFSLEELSYPFKKTPLACHAKSHIARFWFEYAYRLKKLVAVLVILEKENLKAFGGIPEATDCPQALTFVGSFVEAFYIKGENKRLKEEYLKEMNEVKKMKLFMTYYYSDTY
jgi:hypothetical protein